MKATGIVRRVDELGRVVLPIELRRNLDLDIKDPLEIDVNGDEILLKKYVPRCIFCKSIEDVKEVKGKCICRECLDRIKAL
ncbi:MAG: AbrB/MazE/SpoVT family DNA-binding domain-containing protein [Clostridiaceae bacterium]|nr:AbrB/MazE/SpoVT family DNA-binding domain-containing protein [Clostridiaceae bacterium]